eukprot:807338-Pleurochrysis_carterae.AAC.5
MQVWQQYLRLNVMKASKGLGCCLSRLSARISEGCNHGANSGRSMDLEARERLDCGDSHLCKRMETLEKDGDRLDRLPPPLGRHCLDELGALRHRLRHERCHTLEAAAVFQLFLPALEVRGKARRRPA